MAEGEKDEKDRKGRMEGQKEEDNHRKNRWVSHSLLCKKLMDSRWNDEELMKMGGEDEEEEETETKEEDEDEEIEEKQEKKEEDV